MCPSCRSCRVTIGSRFAPPSTASSRAAGSSSAPKWRRSSRNSPGAMGAAHAVGVGTGTDAIALVLRALDIGPGDEVITTPLSAAYTALAVMMTGARPVFADVDPVHLTLDPDRVEQAIGPRTRAILPVHLYGQAADMARARTDRRPPQSADRRRLLPGAPRDRCRPSGRHDRRGGGVQLLSDQEPRRAR